MLVTLQLPIQTTKYFHIFFDLHLCPHFEKDSVLAVQVKNSAKITLLSFNKTDVFLYDVIVSKNDDLEVR